MRVNYSEPYRIEAEWHPEAEPRFPGPWTRRTWASAEGFINHNTTSLRNKDHGLVRMKLFELQPDGSERLILSVNTQTGVENVHQ